ncbi:MAG TPA: FkbM family methyltransferase, partial [Methylococcales bacterium]
MLPIILKTKYAFHALLWLLEPDLIFDVGSMDGSDAKKFIRLIPKATVVAFEANPKNYLEMCADIDLQRLGVRVEQRLVSNQSGNRSFFIQRPIATNTEFNRGTSSAISRCEQGMEIDEISIDALRIDSFLTQEYPDAKRVALWVDVEGFSYEVLEGIYEIQDHVYLIHIEAETQEIWPGQKIEADILALAKGMGFIPIARGANNIQRDIILIKESWYNANRDRILTLLH